MKMLQPRSARVPASKEAAHRLLSCLGQVLGALGHRIRERDRAGAEAVHRIDADRVQIAKAITDATGNRDAGIAAGARSDGDAGRGLAEGRLPIDPTFAGERELGCLLYTSPSPRDRQKSRMPSSA